jgi:hypothetical protein
VAWVADPHRQSVRRMATTGAVVFRTAAPARSPAEPPTVPQRVTPEDVHWESKGARSAWSAAVPLAVRLALREHRGPELAPRSGRRVAALPVFRPPVVASAGARADLPLLVSVARRAEYPATLAAVVSRPARAAPPPSATVAIASRTSPTYPPSDNKVRRHSTAVARDDPTRALLPTPPLPTPRLLSTQQS